MRQNEAMCFMNLHRNVDGGVILKSNDSKTSDGQMISNLDIIIFSDQKRPLNIGKCLNTGLVIKWCLIGCMIATLSWY